MGEIYKDFKGGIKSDINETGISLFLIGGLFILIIVIVSALFVAIKAYKMDTCLRIFLGAGAILLGALMIFNRKALNLILGIWLMLLVAAIVLPILFLIGYMFYLAFKEPYYSD